MRIRILIFSSLTFTRCLRKTYFLTVFFCFLRFEGTCTSFSKIKSQKEVTKQWESRLFLLFLLGDRRIQIRSRIRIHTSDWWIRIQEAQNMWIRIRNIALWRAGCFSGSLKNSSWRPRNNKYIIIVYNKYKKSCFFSTVKFFNFSVFVHLKQDLEPNLLKRQELPVDRYESASLLIRG